MLFLVDLFCCRIVQQTYKIVFKLVKSEKFLNFSFIKSHSVFNCHNFYQNILPLCITTSPTAAEVPSDNTQFVRYTRSANTTDLERLALARLRTLI